MVSPAASTTSVDAIVPAASPIPASSSDPALAFATTTTASSPTSSSTTSSSTSSSSVVPSFAPPTDALVFIVHDAENCMFSKSIDASLLFQRTIAAVLRTAYPGASDEALVRTQLRALITWTLVPSRSTHMRPPLEQLRQHGVRVVEASKKRGGADQEVRRELARLALLFPLLHPSVQERVVVALVSGDGDFTDSLQQLCRAGLPRERVVLLHGPNSSPALASYGTPGECWVELAASCRVSVPVPEHAVASSACAHTSSETSDARESDEDSSDDTSSETETETCSDCDGDLDGNEDNDARDSHVFSMPLKQPLCPRAIGWYQWTLQEHVSPDPELCVQDGVAEVTTWGPTPDAARQMAARAKRVLEKVEETRWRLSVDRSVLGDPAVIAATQACNSFIRVEPRNGVECVFGEGGSEAAVRERLEQAGFLVYGVHEQNDGRYVVMLDRRGYPSGEELQAALVAVVRARLFAFTAMCPTTVRVLSANEEDKAALVHTLLPLLKGHESTTVSARVHMTMAALKKRLQWHQKGKLNCELTETDRAVDVVVAGSFDAMVGILTFLKKILRQ